MEEKVTDRLQAYAETLAGHAGSKAYMTDATEMSHIRSVWEGYAQAIVHTENRLLRQEHVAEAVAGEIQATMLDLLNTEVDNETAETAARRVITAITGAIDPHSRALTELVHLAEEAGLYDYAEKMRQSMSPKTVAALREKLESGDFAVRKVKRRES